MQHPEWPGERDPSQWDVHDAYWTPEVSFLQRFKAVLLLSPDAAGSRQYVDREGIRADATRSATDLSVSKATPQYTYPMAVLLDLPSPPDDVILDRSQALFHDSFKRHFFLNRIAIPAPSSGRLIPPYLKLSLACLGTTLSRDLRSSASTSSEQLYSNLCVTAMRLWGVMMEIDNREARLIDSVLAVILTPKKGSLIATYGMLTADSEFWDLSSATLAGTTTMARRLRLHYADMSSGPDKPLLESNPNASSLLTSYLFLADVVHAAHAGTVPRMSSSELFIRMPLSSYYFKPMYACLMSGVSTLPADMKSEEDALLLLTAICADILYAHFTFSGIVRPTQDANTQSAKIRNPYVPLSAESEALRHARSFDGALKRWYQHFGHVASANILSLFYFCRLVHVSPMILSLPRLARYAPTKKIPLSEDIAGLGTTKMTEEAVNFAWLILDKVEAGSGREDSNFSVWLPVVLFYATLTVWYQLQKQTSSSSLRTGTLRTLRMFRSELERLPWPCCIEMCLTLDRLMERPDELRARDQ